MKTARFLLPLLLAASLAGAATAGSGRSHEPPRPSGAPVNSGLHDDLGSGEAVVWYLGHCGYAVRTRNHLLIFDYQEASDGQEAKPRPESLSLENGFVVPDQIRDQRVRVFVTHSHSDHFDPVIFKWKETIPDIAYYSGWQAAEDPAFHYMLAPRAESKSGDLEIFTVNSHHSGVPEVAYLVRVDGLVIYHNGDYMGAFEEDYPFLKAKAERIDLAFTTPVTDENAHYGRQNMALFEMLRPRAVFPMHAAAGKAMYAEFEKVWRSRIPGLPIALPRRIGERFVFRAGGLTTDRSSGPGTARGSSRGSSSRIASGPPEPLRSRDRS